jgi:hypothetical protein
LLSRLRKYVGLAPERLTRVHDRARVATILVERDRILGFDSRMISTCDQLRLDSG